MVTNGEKLLWLGVFIVCNKQHNIYYKLTRNFWSQNPKIWGYICETRAEQVPFRANVLLPIPFVIFPGCSITSPLFPAHQQQ